MKRPDLVRRILTLGAVYVREGGEHSIYQNPRTGMLLAVPRHREIGEDLARKIIRDARR